MTESEFVRWLQIEICNEFKTGPELRQSISSKLKEIKPERPSLAHKFSVDDGGEGNDGGGWGNPAAVPPGPIYLNT